LLLSVLVLFVVITLSIQIGIGTMTDARVARNDLGLAAMDDAIESALLEVAEQLKNDAAGGEGGDEAGMDPLSGGMDPTAGGGGAEGGGAVDSKEDEWARPQRTEINGMELRIFIQDEDSKYNVLNLLDQDEEVAEENVLRVARIIDLAREGTDLDISLVDAESMARDMREHMLVLYSPPSDPAEFLTSVPGEDRRLPLSLREFLVVDGFEEHHFRDFRDESGAIVHSLGAFLTVWSCLTDGAEGGGTSAANGGASGTLEDASSGVNEAQDDGSITDVVNNKNGASAAGNDGSYGADGAQSEAGSAAEQTPNSSAASGQAAGFGVNINTAPAAVLKGLFDDRDVSMSFWDDVIEYRNLEEEVELEPGAEEPEPVYDEYGNEVIQRQVFDSLEELQEVPSWGDLSVEEQELVQMHVTTTSQVFSVYVTARRSTSNRDDIFIATSAAERDREEESAAGLVRTVRSLVWRRDGGNDGAAVDPVIRWEVFDFSPYEVQDYPDEDR